jgi:DNA-directed RNA polymerase subunit M/transcription elongation factor TFIIS
MHFCIQCGNMYYITVRDDDDKSLEYNCRYCGHKSMNLVDACVMYTQISESKSNYAHVINEYTKFDPTLPRTATIKCPYKDDKPNLHVAQGDEVIYIRYDDSNLRFIYVCTQCDYTWTNNVQ